MRSATAATIRCCPTGARTGSSVRLFARCPADRSGICLAGNGRWGATLPELLYWYRVNPAALRDSRWGTSFTVGAPDLRVRVQERNRHILDGGFLEVKDVPTSVQLEPVSWSSPINGLVGSPGSRAIMLLLPWSVSALLAVR